MIILERYFGMWRVSDLKKPGTILFFLLLGNQIAAQEKISDFVSLGPMSVTTDFIIPESHVMQKIIEAGDPLSEGGVLPIRNDFTAYVAINGSSENGYLSINSERNPGGVSILDINFETTSKIWQTTASEAVDFSGVAGTINNCSGTVTPWNTIISCEEFQSPVDTNADGYYDIGWCIEISPETKTVIDKLWALGNFRHENVVIHQNERTLYQGADSTPGYLYKFVADTPGDLSSGALYVYSGAKNGSGNWVQLANATPAERNSTLTQSVAVGATEFRGIEDVEIGPDGWVYFAVKSEDRVYRFQDSDPIAGTTVLQMETYVGNATYPIAHSGGTSMVAWGSGNDNLVFDGDGNLWVTQDSSLQGNYIWVVESGHTQAAPKVKIFGRSPKGSEPTGITFSPDYRFLFMSIQHPDAANDTSTQLDTQGQAIAFNTGTSLVIALKQNLGTLWYKDADNDGFATETINSHISPGEGYTTTPLPLNDCNDQDATLNPNTVWYLDADRDGHAEQITINSCTQPGAGYTMETLPTDDCDDQNPEIREASLWYMDADQDGFATLIPMLSCTSPGIGYTTSVLPTTDCDDNNALLNPETIWYLDADGDGHAVEMTITSCTTPGIGYTTEELPTDDCNDMDAATWEAKIWYIDADGDGFASQQTLLSCDNPGGDYTDNVLPATDCDDNDPLINPNTIWYLDADGDGYSSEITSVGCGNPGEGFSTQLSDLQDCDDTNPEAQVTETWYLDLNMDGFAEGEPELSCGSPGEGYTNTFLPPEKELAKAGELLIYPNPTAGVFTINLDGVFRSIEITVINSAEQLVHKEKFENSNRVTLSLPQLSSGIYYIHFMGDGKKIAQPIIINR